MGIKKYHEQKKEQVQIAKTGLEVIEEVSKDVSSNSLISADELKNLNTRKKKFQNVLENPRQAANRKVLEISNIVAQIKEVGLSSENPAVANWAEQELGIGAEEFDEMLKSSRTSEEIQNNILEMMEVPRNLIEKSTRDSAKKKV